MRELTRMVSEVSAEDLCDKELWVTFDTDALMYDVFLDDGAFLGSISSDEIQEIPNLSPTSVAIAASNNSLPAPHITAWEERSRLALGQLLANG